MKGYVYVISNKAMPGLLKVGFSRRDPEFRAQELSSTASPHPYKVDFELLTRDPRKVEQSAHRLLSRFREGKEWFRCNEEIAVKAVIMAAGKDAIRTFYTRTERDGVERGIIRDTVAREIRRIRNDYRIKRQVAIQSIDDAIEEEKTKTLSMFDTGLPLLPSWGGSPIGVLIDWLLCVTFLFLGWILFLIVLTIVLEGDYTISQLDSIVMSGYFGIAVGAFFLYRRRWRRSGVFKKFSHARSEALRRLGLK